MALDKARAAEEQANDELTNFLINRMLAVKEKVTPTALPAHFDWVADRNPHNRVTLQIWTFNGQLTPEVDVRRYSR